MLNISQITDFLYIFRDLCLHLPCAALKILTGNYLRNRITKKELSEFVLNKKSTFPDDCLISVIIPSFNEEAGIRLSLESALKDNNVEILVSDGGSRDATLSIVEEYICSLPSNNLSILTGGKCRSECQNIGFSKVSGDIVLFLHADSILPSDWGIYVRESMRDPTHTMGCFRFKLQMNDESITLTSFQRFAISCVEIGTNIRSRYFSLPYGDQGLFFRRNVFSFLGKFPSIPLMEDFELVQTIRRIGTIDVLPIELITSGRRWIAKGIIGNTLFNQVVILGWYLGVSYNRLAQWYYGLSKQKNY